MEGGRIDGDTEIILPDTEEIVMVAGVRMSSSALLLMTTLVETRTVSGLSEENVGVVAGVGNPVGKRLDVILNSYINANARNES